MTAGIQFAMFGRSLTILLEASVKHDTWQYRKCNFRLSLRLCH